MDTLSAFTRRSRPQDIDRYMATCPYCKRTWAIEGKTPWQRSREDQLALVEAHATVCEKTSIRIKVRINPHRLSDPSFPPYTDPKLRAQVAYDILTADWKVRGVTGIYNPDVKCGAKCRNSKGPNCECSCAGKNHGAGFSGF